MPNTIETLSRRARAQEVYRHRESTRRAALPRACSAPAACSSCRPVATPPPLIPLRVWLARRSQHYVDWVDDQFDFHSYCLRKMTVNAYVDLLRFVDNLHARSMYEKAALAMIECYLYGPQSCPSLR